MRRQYEYKGKNKTIFWTVIICVSLLSVGLQTPIALAYQSNEATPSPTLTLESVSALPTEDTQPAFTNTTEPTVTASLTETTTNLSFNAPVSTENSATPTFTISLQVPVLFGEYVSDEVLVRFKNQESFESVLQCVTASNAKVAATIEEINVWVVQVLSGHVAESIAAISACPNVRYVEPNYMASIADTIPSDSNWGLQYGLVNIHAPQGWDYSTGSAAVTIAIVDSGVDLGHVDLAGKIVPGYDFVNGDAIPQDDNGHGTHVAGIAAASGNNGIGVAGVSWGARIMPVKVLNSSGNGSFLNVADGIIWATDHGAQVINLSLGGVSSSLVLQDSINYAYGKGVVLIAAAGNTGSNFVLYPARYPNVIAVGAVDITNNRMGISNFGPELDVVAPGASIYSTVIGGYDYKSGTSMAVPYVSGLAAILRGYPAGYTPAAIALEIESSALDLGIPGVDNLYGYGLIQMDHAIQMVYGTATPTTTSIPMLLIPADGSGDHPMANIYNGIIPTFTPSFTPSGTAFMGGTETGTPAQIELPSAIQEGQETEIAELYALSASQEREKKAQPVNFIFPCLAIGMILMGIWLFTMAGRRKYR